MRRNRIGRFAVVATAAALAVTAWGASGQASGPVAATATTEAESDSTEAADTESTEAADTAAEGTAAEGTAAEEPAAEAEPLPGEHHVTDEGDPVAGGDLVYGVEADSANGWAPYRTSCATSCNLIFRSLSDPLFTATDSGDIAPMLIESWEASEDYTTWTFNVRDGISFHDGTPLDGAAVAFNINTCRGSALTGSSLAQLTEVTGEGQAVTITLSSPNVVLPRAFTERQCAYMFSPTWMSTLDDVPQRVEGNIVFDEAVAAESAGGDPTTPVGVGAFTFESYSPGNGNSFRVVRNEDYWRGPNGITGEELPYLDSIEFVVAVDVESRSASLSSGQFDLIHSSNTDAIAPFLDDDTIEVSSSSKFGDTNYIMLNHAAGDDDPDGANAASPLLNVNCRRALAAATDVPRLIEERAAGLTQAATGPFTRDMIGYLEDSGYPTYDPDAAKAWLETCLSELGTDSIQFSFNTTNDPFNVETNTLMISMWNDVFGSQVNASIEPIEQGQYIGLALVGTFNAFAWRNHGGIDPDTQNYWWNSASSGPIGTLALNFGRIRDDNIDAQLEILRTNPDDAARVAAAEEINRIFGDQVYNLWTTWAIWGVMAQPYVNGVETNVIPGSDDAGVGLAFSGLHQLNQIWCNEGSCG
ncbi:MAG: ABC transporter substrate-binding protein [Desertimonas sp.]